MGFVEMTKEQVEDLKKLASTRATDISFIVSELNAYMDANPKMKELPPYEISDFVAEEPENVRFRRAKSIASQVQNKIRIKTTASRDGNHYYLLVNKNLEIVQPTWLQGKQTKRD